MISNVQQQDGEHQQAFSFDGETFDPRYDLKRLASQYERVFTLMSDGKWRTLAEIRERCGGTEAAVSARLRDARKERFGGHTVNRRTVGIRERGLFEYQLIINRGAAAA